MKRLAELLRSRRTSILEHWRVAVVGDPTVPVAARLPEPALRDHVPQILDAIIVALERGFGASESEEGRALAESVMPRAHATQRFEQGYTLAATVRELSHLRASVLDAYWGEHDLDVRGVRFLHAALDQCTQMAAVQIDEADRAGLKEAVEIREKFVAILGHDLRGPLNTIKMAGSLLLTGVPDHQRNLTVRVVRAADRMNLMIQELLDFSKARAGGVELERKPTDLRHVCDELVDELRLAHPERTIVSTTRGDLVGDWDPVRLAQVLSNLISNALAYSPHGTRVSISAQPTNEHVEVSVHNEGPSIPPTAQQHLFEAFYRGGADGNRGGLGLGLYIASEVVHAHAGTIAVRSEAPDGTTFTVSLPRHPMSPKALQRNTGDQNASLGTRHT